MASWTSPKTWSDGSALSASELNEQIRDNETWLKDALATHGITSDSTIQPLLGAPYGAKATKTTSQSITDSTETAVQFSDADELDSDALHDTSTNNTRVTIGSGEDGWFWLGCSGRFDGNATGNRRMFARLNGTTLIEGTEIRIGASGTNNMSMSSSTILALAAGDYVELMVYQSSGGNLNLERATLAVARLFKT